MFARMILLTILLASPIMGQTFGERSPKGQTLLQQVADRQLSEIVSNQPDRVRANKPFTLLLVYDPQSRDQATAWLQQYLQAPQSTELQQWIGAADFRMVAINSPHAEKLKWHLQKHQTLPILMLQESPGTSGEGAVWYSAGGNEIPLDEGRLSQELARWFAATVAAQGTTDLNRMPTPNQVGPMYPDYYVPVPRSSQNFARDRKPLINPQIDIAVPDKITTSVEAGLRKDTIRGLMMGGFFVLLSVLALGYSLIHAARIIAEAITEDPTPQGS